MLDIFRNVDILQTPLVGKQKMMIHVFYKNRNTIGQFMVATDILRTFGFCLRMMDLPYIIQWVLQSCCISGEAAVTSFALQQRG